MLINICLQVVVFLNNMCNFKSRNFYNVTPMMAGLVPRQRKVRVFLMVECEFIKLRHIFTGLKVLERKDLFLSLFNEDQALPSFRNRVDLNADLFYKHFAPLSVLFRQLPSDSSSMACTRL